MDDEIIKTVIGITRELFEEDILLEINRIGEMSIGLDLNPMDYAADGE